MAGLARDWVPLAHDAMGGNHSSDYGSLICLSTIYLRVPSIADRFLGGDLLFVDKSAFFDSAYELSLLFRPLSVLVVASWSDQGIAYCVYCTFENASCISWGSFFTLGG